MGRISLLNFKADYIAIEIKYLCFQRGRYIPQWNRIENSEIYPHKYAQMTLTKVQKQFNRGKIVF